MDDTPVSSCHLVSGDPWCFAQSLTLAPARHLACPHWVRSWKEASPSSPELILSSFSSCFLSSQEPPEATCALNRKEKYCTSASAGKAIMILWEKLFPD